MTPDFSRRSAELEIMDDRALNERDLALALDELAVINRTLNGFAPSLKGVCGLLPPDTRVFTLLDVGTGGGDVARRLHSWASERSIEAHIRGIDVSPPTIEYARRRCADADGVEFEIEDLLDLPDTVSFDIVHCALVLHHFEGDAAVAALRKMFALSRWGVVINELDRHPLAYYSIKLLTRLFSESPMIRNDAPLSVLRAFQREDFRRLALEAGLPEPCIRWHWAFRWCVLFRK
jgi:2-polyprenyl-3-methyl-5-hydroxy-6-metoxy-1,4-benzoquinol methylase